MYHILSDFASPVLWRKSGVILKKGKYDII